MNPPDPVPANADPPTDEPASAKTTPRLVGTRTCLGCGHELAGQAIIRTVDEELPFVRCSECGRAAHILEYPVISRWSGTLGVGLLCLHLQPERALRHSVQTLRHQSRFGLQIPLAPRPDAIQSERALHVVHLLLRDLLALLDHSFVVLVG